MDALLTVWAVAVLAFWLAIAADRKRFWPRDLTLDLDAGPIDRDVLVAIPARNEADVARECLGSLLAQCDDFARLVYVDDRSEDGTGDVARELARDVATADVLTGRERPAGWSGKLHALHTAIEHHRESDWRWLLMTDADIRHPPGSIRALRAQADRGFDLVSVMVRLHAEGFWERLLIPPFVYFFQLLYPFRRVADSVSSVAAAAGGCVLVSRQLYERSGGLESIRGAIIDDVAFARQVKRNGGRVWLGHCASMVSLRRYDRFGEIASMVARTAFTQLGESYLLLLGCLVWLALFLVAPPVLVVAAPLGVATACAAAAWAIQAWTLLPVVRHHRVGWPYAWTLPVASIAYGWMTALSGVRHLGGGPRWKGRTTG